MKKSYSISAFWDKGAVKPDKTSRVMITVNMNKQQFRITVKLYCTRADFDKAVNGITGGSDAVKKLRQGINKYILKAESILDRMPNATKDTFLRFFKSDTNLSISSKTDVYEFFKDWHSEVLKDKRFGAYQNVRCCWYSFRNYRASLNFEDIDERFLKGYREWMLAKGCSETTIGMYLRDCGLYIIELSRMELWLLVKPIHSKEYQ